MSTMKENQPNSFHIDIREKGIFLLPSIFTTLSLFAGFFSIVRSISSLDEDETHFYSAAVAIIIASLFDAFDGRVARLTKTDSNFGVFYDAITDVCSFGVAPAILMYVWGLRPFGEIGWAAAFIFLACGALRLARFGSAFTQKKESKKYFRGLPIPVGAGVVASTVMAHHFFEGRGNVEHEYVVVLALVLGFLMISNVRFRSFKQLELTERVSFKGILAFVALVLFIILKHEITIPLIYWSYILFGIAEEIWYWKNRKLRDIEPFIEAESEFLDET